MILEQEVNRDCELRDVSMSHQAARPGRRITWQWFAKDKREVTFNPSTKGFLQKGFGLAESTCIYSGFGRGRDGPWK